MKKSLVVLLIAVLALTSAFAAITGSATAKYTFDLDKKEATYSADPSVSVTFKYNEKLAIAKKGEGTPYIDAAASATVYYATAVAGGKDGVKVSLDLDKFQVVGEDWTLDFIAEYEALDFAQSAIDFGRINNTTKKCYEYYPYTYAVAAPTESPVLKLTKEEVGSITFIGSQVATPTNAHTSTIGVELESDADGFAITPDLTANAGVTVYSTKVTGEEANVNVAVSAKTAYVGEVATSKLAADFGWDNTNKKLSADVAFNAVYGVFTLDTYYGKGALKYKTTAVDPTIIPAKGYFSAQAVANVPEIKTIFTANGKNLFNAEKYNFNFDVETKYFEHFTLTAGVADLTHAGRAFNLGIEADFTEYGTTAYAKLTAIDKAAKPTLALGFTWTDTILSLAADYSYDFAKEHAEFGFNAEYAAEKYTATADLCFNPSDYTGAFVPGWYLEAGISSDYVVNGATLALEYASEQLDATPAGLGTITASCTVEF